MGQQMDLIASIGEQRYTVRFIDDDTEYVDMEISSDSPKPLAAQRHRVKREAMMRRLETGEDQTIDEIVHRYLSSTTQASGTPPLRAHEHAP
jgi:hypothetical protein